MTLQKVTCTNSCQHAINLRSSPFAIRSIQYSYFQRNQYESKSNTTAVDRRQLHRNVVTTATHSVTHSAYGLTRALPLDSSGGTEYYPSKMAWLGIPFEKSWIRPSKLPPFDFLGTVRPCGKLAPADLKLCPQF